MKEQIKLSKRKNNLEIRLIVPLKTQRCNPYDEDYCPEMDHILGLVEEKMSQCGFAYWIDMAYKGKPDQYTDYFYKYQGGIEAFRKLCKKLGISVYNI